MHTKIEKSLLNIAFVSYDKFLYLVYFVAIAVKY